MTLFQYRSKANADHTIKSGQVFLWRMTDGAWYGVNGSDVVRVRQEPFEASCKYDLFRMTDKYDSILDSISKDATMKRAVQKYGGLRILRQDPFQCMISFIVSSNSNIGRIRRSLLLLCRTFGKKRKAYGSEFWLFPSPGSLASASLGQLQSCGLGYRAPFVKAAASMVSGREIDLEELKSADYCTARDELLQVPGIGRKVADCILLFSLEKLDAFPLDRWMIRVLSEEYPKMALGPLTPGRYDAVRGRLVEYFGEYAGYAQQFLFKMRREEENAKW